MIVVTNENYSKQRSSSLSEGLSLGPFYANMMYSNNYITGKLKGTELKMSQKQLSEVDEQALDYDYSDSSVPFCTYDCYGENYFEQIWYECLDCWGKKSSYGCCSNCMVRCHQGHRFKKHTPGKFICDCGIYKHKKGKCTKVASGQEFVKQIFFQCLDCFDDGSELIVCLACQRKCHKGHRLTKGSVLNGFCDCGLSGCKISCKID